MPTIEKSVKEVALTIAGTKPVSKLEYHATVRDMPTDQRPRERLRDYGSQALSNAELLAIILRTGTSQDNVLELAGKLLAKYGGLSGLMRAEFSELCAEHGLGEAKTAQLKAALEIGRRLGMLQSDERYQIKSPADAANLVMMEMTYLDHEHSAIQVPFLISTLSSDPLTCLFRPQSRRVMQVEHGLALVQEVFSFGSNCTHCCNVRTASSATSLTMSWADCNRETNPTLCPA